MTTFRKPFHLQNPDTGTAATVVLICEHGDYRSEVRFPNGGARGDDLEFEQRMTRWWNDVGDVRAALAEQGADFDEGEWR